MPAIEADHYRTTRKELAADPLIRDMAAGLEGVPLDQLQHAPGEPRGPFMMGALEEYRKRGGTIGSHIGGPAQAILGVIAEWTERSPLSWARQCTAETLGIPFGTPEWDALEAACAEFDAEVRS